MALPPGWTRHTCNTTGREYFHHTVSGRSQWEEPEWPEATPAPSRPPFRPEARSASTKNIVMVGNPGTGKSTLLNGLIGRPAFRSGVSFGAGLTYKLQLVEHNGIRYMDTPGLADDKLREQAATAITQALRQGGLYKVFFVCTLQQGRVRPEDAVTIKLVLDAAEELTAFGVIVNQVPPPLMRELLASKGRPGFRYERVMEELSSRLTPEQARGLHLELHARDDDLDGEDNMVKAPARDLREFILDRLPAVRVRSQSVRDVEADERARLQREHAERVAALERQREEQERENRRREQEALQRQREAEARYRAQVAEAERQLQEQRRRQEEERRRQAEEEERRRREQRQREIREEEERRQRRRERRAERREREERRERRELRRLIAACQIR